MKANDIEDKIKELLDEKQRLVDILKQSYYEAYKFLVDKGVDLHNLSNYAKSISAIFILSFNLSSLKIPKSFVFIHKKDQEVRQLNSDELRRLSIDEQEALVTWEKYARYIQSASSKYGVDPRIIMSTIMVESRGNPNALRYEPSINDASYGLGQILYSTSRLIGYGGSPDGLYNPEINIDLIGKYHRRNFDVYGDITMEKLATAYNAGNPYSTATYGYVSKFSYWYQVMEKLFKS